MFSFTRYQIIAACVIVGIALIGTGVLIGKSCRPPDDSNIRVSGPAIGGSDSVQASETAEESSESQGTLYVHVAGKVRNPGVYELKPGSRVKDAIDAAGGAFSNADLESVNLAAKLSDGQQVYIAAKGVIPPPSTSVVRAPEGAGSSQAAETGYSDDSRRESGPVKLTVPGEGTVNINTAGLEELQRLPGVGPATAQKILDYRKAHGRFTSVDELDAVSGIGPAKLAKLRPFVSL